MKHSKAKKTRGGIMLFIDNFLSGKLVRILTWTTLLTLILFLGIWGICLLLGSNVSLPWAYIQLTNPSPWQDIMGRADWLSTLLINAFGIFVFNGVVVTILVNWIASRRERHLNGEARYDKLTRRRFTVIIGGHPMAASLSAGLVAKDSNDFVIIQTRRPAQELRKEIAAAIDDDGLRRRVVIYSGDRTSWHELEELHLELANEVYIIGETTEIDGTAHDALNMKCWQLICANISAGAEEDTCRGFSVENKDGDAEWPVKKKVPRMVPCHVMFEYQSSFSVFQTADLDMSRSKKFRFIPFSFYETWAQQVLVHNALPGTKNCYVPLDGFSGLGYDSKQRVHLIVIGMSKMGVALALEAAQTAHYLNFNNPAAGRPRTLITFIDRDCRREMLFFTGRFRTLFQLARWRYVKAPATLMPHRDWKIYDTSADIAEGTNALYRWTRPLENPRFPYAGEDLGLNLMDIDFEFIEGDVEQPSVQRYIRDACADNDPAGPSSLTTVAACMPSGSEALSAALYLEPSVYQEALQILVCQSESSGMVDAISAASEGFDRVKYAKLRPFGMIDSCNYMALNENYAAKFVALAYKIADVAGICNDSIPEEKRDADFDSVFREIFSRKDIHEIADTEWKLIGNEKGKSAMVQKWSNIYSSLSIPAKLRGIGLLTSDGLSTDAMHNVGGEELRVIALTEHNRWVMEQILLGYRPMLLSQRAKAKELKSVFKSMKIHSDIRENEKLGSISKYDEAISKVISCIIVKSLNK